MSFKTVHPYQGQPHLLFIAQDTPQQSVLVSSCNSSTYPILYSGFGSVNELSNLLQNNGITAATRVAFAFASGSLDAFFSGKYYYDTAPELIDLVTKLNATKVDFLACNTLQHSEWTDLYAKFPASVTVGASNDTTGNLVFGGNWTMENTQEEVRQIYFTDTITAYNELLDFGDHTAIVLPDGTAWASGSNLYGQLGDGTNTNRLTLIQMRDSSGVITNVRQISCGERHTALVKWDGSVWACGFNGYGALGNGATENSSTFVQMCDSSGVITNAEQVSCGQLFTVVRRLNGTAYACGRNIYGQLGNETTIDKTTLVQICDISGSITDATYISAGGFHTAVVRTNGTVWACGFNDTGQLGDGTTTHRLTLVQMRDSSGFITGVSNVAGGYYHTILRKTNGTAWACGQNPYGQLGDGTNTNRWTLVQMKDSYGFIANVSNVVCGSFHSVVVKSNSSVWACGYNSSGQLGIGNTTSKSTFTSPIVIPPVWVGPLITYTPMMSVYCPYSGILIVSMSNTIGICGVGSNLYGELGVGSTGTYTSVRSVPFYYDCTLSVAQLKQNGYLAKQLKLAGYSCIECFKAGYSVSDLRTAGFSGTELNMLCSFTQ